MTSNALEADGAGRPVALVSGGARGAGRGIVCKLAQAGLNVVVADLSDTGDQTAHEAEETCRRARELGAEAMSIHCDVRDPEQTRTTVQRTLERFDRLDLVVANAGIIRRQTVVEISADDWRDTMSVNLDGVFHLCSAATATFVAQRSGCFVTVSSVAAYRGATGYVGYATSKAASIAFTRALAMELAKFGIRANSVCPGYVDTDMWRRSILPAEEADADRHQDVFTATIEAEVPLGRPQTAEDIGDAVAYLWRAQNVTGVELIVDGGHLAMA